MDFGLSIEMFKPTGRDESVQIGGIVIEGEPGKPVATSKPIGGRASFIKVAMKEGAPVIEMIEVSITEPVGERRQDDLAYR